LKVSTTKTVKPWVIIMSSIVLLLSYTSLGAELPTENDKPIPCRPTVSCNADISVPGILEIEAGGLYHPDGPALSQFSMPFLAKLSTASWSQLQVGSNGYTVVQGSQPAYFFDDFTMGEKFHILDQKEYSPAFSFSGTLNIPASQNQSIYTRAYDAFFVAYVSKDVGSIHFDFNVGLNEWNIDTSSVPQQFAAFATSTNLNANWGAVGELYAISDSNPIAAKDGGFRVAASYSPRGWAVVDFGADLGFYPSIRSFSVFAGVTLVPAVLWRPKPIKVNSLF
jgi:hypothetical protein